MKALRAFAPKQQPVEPEPLDDYLQREHGRLVARLKRLAERADATGLPTHRKTRMLETVRELMVVERLMALDDLQRKDRAAVTRALVVGPDEVRRRLELMTPGAGIVVPR